MDGDRMFPRFREGNLMLLRALGINRILSFSCAFVTWALIASSSQYSGPKMDEWAVLIPHSLDKPICRPFQDLAR